MNGDKNRRRISTASISSAREGRLRRRSSASQPNAQVTTILSPGVPSKASRSTPDDMEVDELERSMSALRFVPLSVAKNRAKMNRTHS